MKTFKTLQEVINYIPNCIICQKEMNLGIEGYLSPVDSKKPRWGKGTERVCFKLDNKEGILYSKHKGPDLAIEAETNRVILGEDIINRLMLSTINIKKSCPTCVFKIISAYRDGNVKKTNYFPTVTLRSEEISYTMRGGKRVSLINHYDFSRPNEENKCFITYNNRPLHPILIDFSRLSNLDQINKKIKTIITFQ